MKRNKKWKLKTLKQKKKKKSTDESEKGWKMLMGSKRTAEVL